jgi:putative aldouronate transport system permease protein
MHIKRTAADWVFDIIIYIVLGLLVVATIYPFLNALAISLNEASDTTRGGITIFPRRFTIENYRTISQNDNLYRAFVISVLRTVIGAFGSVLITGFMAYALSKKHLKGRKIYMTICIVTMYFSGGLIPYFLLLRSIGLLNTFWVYIIPNLVNVWNMIIMRTYFKGLPESVEEAARVDGASTWQVYFRIVLPMSAPIIATIALFSGVFQWNSWFDAAVFVTDRNLRPLQNVLNEIINSSRFAEEIAKAGVDATRLGRMNIINSRSITMATMIAVILPIIMVYPFIQKYFAKGMMIGSLKE